MHLTSIAIWILVQNSKMASLMKGMVKSTLCNVLFKNMKSMF